MFGVVSFGFLALRLWDPSLIGKTRIQNTELSIMLPQIKVLNIASEVEMAALATRMRCQLLSGPGASDADD